jgi:purine-binding chemotaxis protein CheW
MNLAEIRKKARLEKAGQAVPTDAIPSSLTLAVPEQPECILQTEVYCDPAALPAEYVAVRRETSENAVTSDYVPDAFDPLAILLAGRRDAGSAADTVAMSREESIDSSGDVLKYLRFRVADEDYGVSLLEIREIIKLRAITEVPRMPEYVAGVLSLRGAITPVFDLRLRLGLPVKELFGLERIIIAKKGDSACGLLVDEVFQVIGLKGTDIEKAPQVLEGIDREFVTGIGRHEGRMLILLDLEKVMNISLR